ncbi:hypothetical protein DL96DRAFT_1658810 [Flagelloscypha sp. PMI_526]|nr:hypothetical protein DL96DRAFT_1658810 [Flagelloscypha sp. PMI_526]
MSLKDEIALEAFSEFLHGRYVADLVWTLCYGFLLAIALVSLYLLRKRASNATRPVQIIRIVIIILTAIVTASLSLQIAATLLVMKWFRSYNIPLTKRYQTAIEAYKVPVLINYILNPLIYAIADAVPLWRAWVLWQHSRGIKWFLIVISLLNSALCVAEGVLMTSAQLHIVDEKRYIHLFPIQIIFSVLANAIATAAIGIKAWQHRKSLDVFRRQSSSAIFILILLVEAGCVLCFIQTANAVLQVLTVFGNFTSQAAELGSIAFSCFCDTFVAAYPSLIVIVIAIQGSMFGEKSSFIFGSANMIQDDKIRKARTLTSIRFAGETSELDEDEADGQTEPLNSKVNWRRQVYTV